MPDTLARVVMRRYPRINGPAGLPLFCLAPHGVFPASRITPRAVSSYLAFSPLPALCCQRTGGIFSVTLSVATILQSRRPRVLRGMPPYGVRTFLWPALRLTSDRLPSVRLYHKLRAFQPSRDASPRRPTFFFAGFRGTARRAIPTWLDGACAAVFHLVRIHAGILPVAAVYDRRIFRAADGAPALQRSISLQMMQPL